MQKGFVQFLIFLLIAVALFSGSFYYQQSKLSEVESEGNAVSEGVAVPESDGTATVEPESTEREVITSGPLRGPVFSAPAENPGALSVAGVVNFTNQHRASAGLSPLKLDLKLSAAASLKVKDMFNKQYFAHESPTGNGPSDLADEAGYEFIMVGENLALGSYKDDRDLVQAWMDSPGHKANILHDRFTEIGVAVMQGTFDGDVVWMAVQEFGLPRNACPEPSASLNNQIEDNQEELDELNEELKERQEDLEDTTPKYGPTYNKKVREYNDLVEIYNDLIKETKSLVEKYNSQVKAFNACASG